MPMFSKDKYDWIELRLKGKALQCWQHPLLQEFTKVSLLVLMIGLVLQLNSWLYLQLTGQTAVAANPFIIIKSTFEIFRQSPGITAYLTLLVAFVIPLLFFAGIFFCYRCDDGGYSIKIFLILNAVMIAWLVCSNTILQYMIYHRLTLGNPFDYLRYWLYSPALPALSQHLIIAGILGMLPLLLIALLISKKPLPNIYGNAHFATKLEVQKAGLFAKKGTLLGKAYSRDLILDGFEHVILFAPTGTGKTTALTIPNLLFWEGSCIASDIKLTLFEHTSKYRQQMGHQVFLWNPGSPDGLTHCYNPLDVISDNPYTRIDEIQKIAAIFIPDNPKSEPIWQAQSRFLFVALVLYILDTPHLPKTIGEVVRLFKRTPNFAEWIAQVLQSRTDLDELCRYNFLKFLELHEKTRLSILATFQSYFELFDNPLIEAATSKSDFDIRKLRQERMTIYVGVTNDNLVRLAPLLTVFYQQVADIMTRKIPTEDEPHGVLFLMDEFSALRRMESFHKNIGLYREYRLKMILIIQELAQLYDTYSRDGAKVFINSKVRIAFTQNDEETCQLISSAVGDMTLEVKNRSQHTNTGLFSNAQPTESIHYVKRPLLLPQEIRRLSENKALILLEGHETVYANKIRWFNEKRFKEKVLGAINIPAVLPTAYQDESSILPADAQLAMHNVIVPTQDIQKTPSEIDELDQTL